jgi:hypothetical protein
MLIEVRFCVEHALRRVKSEYQTLVVMQADVDALLQSCNQRWNWPVIGGRPRNRINGAMPRLLCVPKNSAFGIHRGSEQKHPSPRLCIFTSQTTTDTNTLWTNPSPLVFLSDLSARPAL